MQRVESNVLAGPGGRIGLDGFRRQGMTLIFMHTFYSLS